MYQKSEQHKHVTGVKLDSTVVHLDRIPLLWGLFILEESNCTSMIKRVHNILYLFTDWIVQHSMLNFSVRSKLIESQVAIPSKRPGNRLLYLKQGPA